MTDPVAHGGDPADSCDVVLISLPGYGLSSPLTDASEYGEGEEGWFERGKLSVENESGYGEIQLTKPQTLAALVADSPAGQLA